MGTRALNRYVDFLLEFAFAIEVNWEKVCDVACSPGKRPLCLLIYSAGSQCVWKKFRSKVANQINDSFQRGICYFDRAGQLLLTQILPWEADRLGHLIMRVICRAGSVAEGNKLFAVVGGAEV